MKMKVHPEPTVVQAGDATSSPTTVLPNNEVVTPDADGAERESPDAEEPEAPAPTSCCGKAKDWGRVFCIGLKIIVKPATSGTVVPALHRSILHGDGVTNKMLQQYMTWRCGALMISAISYIVFIGLQGRTMNTSIEKKAAMLSAFPSEVKLFAAGLPKAMMAQEILLFIALCIAGLCIIGAFFSWRSYKRSRTLVFIAWSTGIVVPFGVTMIWPYRLSIDWTGAMNHVCEVTIQESLAFDPSVELVFEKYAATTPSFSDFSAGVNAGTIKPFCKKHTYDWQAQWFGSTQTHGYFLSFLTLGVNNCMAKGMPLFSGPSCTKQNCTVNPCLFDKPAAPASRRLEDAAPQQQDAAPQQEAAPQADGDWSRFPGDQCPGITTADPCNADKECRWATDLNACLQNSALASQEASDCGALTTAPTCVANTNCRWNAEYSTCEAPLQVAMYLKADWQQAQATIAAGGGQASQKEFWFQDYDTALSCYKSSHGGCSPMEMVGDGVCQHECATPQCVYDSLDCCLYLEVDCGATRASRDAVLAPLFANGAAPIPTSGSVDDINSEFANVDDDSYQNHLADEYHIPKEELDHTDWKDMSDDAEKAYGNDGEGVDQELMTQGNKLAKIVQKNMTAKSIDEVITAMGLKVGRLQDNLKAVIGRNVHDTLVKLGFSRRLSDSSEEPLLEPVSEEERRLEVKVTAAQMAEITKTVKSSIAKEMQSFYAKQVPELKTSTSGVVMLEAVGTMSQSSQVATNVFKSAEYFMGMIMGLYALKSLFPLAIGVLGGLTKGIVNIHTLMPATVVGSYLEIIVVVANMPLIVAFLATLYQVVGVVQVIAGLFLLIIYLSMPATRLYWYSFITNYGDKEQVKKANFRLGLFPLFTNLCLAASMCIFIWYLTGLNGADAKAQELIKKIRIKQLFTPEVIATKAFQMFATGLMSAVASADLMFTFEGLVSAHFRRMEIRAKNHLKGALAQYSSAFLKVPDVDQSKYSLDSSEDPGDKEAGKPAAQQEPRFVKDWARIVLIGLKSVLAARASDVVVPPTHLQILEKDGIKCKELQQYAIFRLGSLIVSGMAFVVLIVMQGVMMNETVRKKAELLSAFPPDLKLFAAGFPRALAQMEWAIFASLVFSGFLVIISAIGWRHYKCSRRLVWLAWFIKVAMPFMVLLVWPYRQSVDWKGGMGHICQKTIVNTMNGNPGMKMVFEAFAKTSPDLSTWKTGVTADNAKEFCKIHGWEWQARWFGSTTINGDLTVFMKGAVDNCLSKGINLYSGACTLKSCNINACLSGTATTASTTAAAAPAPAPAPPSRRLEDPGADTTTTVGATDTTVVTTTAAGAADTTVVTTTTVGATTTAAHATDTTVVTTTVGATTTTAAHTDGGATTAVAAVNVGDWTSLPGDSCNTLADSAACNGDPNCKWETDYGGLCLANQAKAQEHAAACSALNGDRDACVRNTVCRWNAQQGTCEATLSTALYTKITYYQTIEYMKVNGDPNMGQFWFQDYNQAWGCYKSTQGTCDPMAHVGDGECSQACAVPACVWDMLDCCNFVGLVCDNAARRDDQMSKLAARGAGFIAAASLEQLAPALQDPDDPAYQNKLADEYSLNKDDIKGTNWNDMDAADAADFGNDPEAVDHQLASQGSAFAKTITKKMKAKAPADLVTSLQNKMSKLENELTAKVMRALKQLAANSRRLETMEIAVKQTVAASVDKEMGDFQKDSVSSLQATATGLTMINMLDAMTKASTLSTTVYKKAEYLLGAYMGLYALKSLLPMSLGVVSGLTKGIVNIHNLFPQTAIGAYIEITVVVASVPQLSAFLATMFQIVGVGQIVPALFCLVMYLSMPGWRMYFYSHIKDHMDRAQIKKADSRLGLVANIFLLVAGVIIIWYVLGMTGINSRDVEYLKAIRIKELFTGPVIYTKVVTVVSAGLLTAVAASDCIMTVEAMAGAHFRRMERSDKEFVKKTFLDWSTMVLRVPPAEATGESK